MQYKYYVEVYIDPFIALNDEEAMSIARQKIRTGKYELEINDVEEI